MIFTQYWTIEQQDITDYCSYNNCFVVDSSLRAFFAQRRELTNCLHFYVLIISFLNILFNEQYTNVLNLHILSCQSTSAETSPIVVTVVVLPLFGNATVIVNVSLFKGSIIRNLNDTKETNILLSFLVFS